MPTTAANAQASAPQGTPGRAAEDLADARAIAAVDSLDAKGAELSGDNRKRSTAAERSLSSADRLKSKTRGRDARKSTLRRRTSRGNKGVGTTVSVGAAAATAMLAKGKSATASGARGLQLAMIQEAFTRLDLDGDGYITPGDLGLAFRNMGRDASERR